MDLTFGHFVNPFTDIGFKIIFGQPVENLREKRRKERELQTGKPDAEEDDFS